MGKWLDKFTKENLPRKSPGGELTKLTKLPPNPTEAVELDLTRADHRQEALAAAKRGDAVLVASGLEAPQAGTAATLTNGQAADVSAPVKHTRRRSLASAPPPHPGPLTNGQQGPLSFLYSVIRGGLVERGTFISQGIRTEPEALEFLRRRYPELRVQWARVIQHPVCGGCRFYTAAVLCGADRAPDHAAVVGSCGRYERAGELLGGIPSE